MSTVNKLVNNPFLTLKITYVKTPPSNNTLGLLQLSISDQRTIRAPSLADAKLYSFLTSDQFGIIVP